MLQVASYSDTGGRPQNEDCVRFSREQDRLCLVVADGLGGHGGGERASRTAAESICLAWNGHASPDSLTSLILEANQAVLALQTPECAMKTTVAALTLEDRRAVWAHVGDSRIYWFHSGGLAFQTVDHSAAQIGVMLGRITPDQIRFHEDRNRVLRALGLEETPTVEVKEQPLPPGPHAFLLCTDGFWEYVLEEEMCSDLVLARDPWDWLARMRSRLEARVPPNNDNHTAAAVWSTEG